MRNSHLYQYAKGLKRAKGSGVYGQSKNNPVGLKKIILLSVASLAMTTTILAPFGANVSYAKAPISKSVQISNNKKAVSIYNKKVPMKKAYQEYLYKLSQERGLDYKKALAVIKTESAFNSKAHGGTNYGYFQINKINHSSLSKKLKTAKKPYDPYVNINWGTYMLADLYKYWKAKGYKGAKLDEAVWSSYNRGLAGYKKYGKPTSYIKKMKTNINYINRLY